MQFIGREAERDFKLHFHRQRVPQDRVFACTQMAIVTLLLLRNSGPLPPPLRLLYWGTYALSFAVLGLSVFARHRYPALRPHLLVCVRVFYDLLCPQLVWHLASQNSRGRSAEQGSWPSFFLLWVTWTRWGSELLTQVGFLLPFNLEALLTPFGALLDMLNRRLCRLLMGGEPTDAQQFYRDTFARLASRLTVPFEMLFAAAPDSSCSAEDGKDCGWSLCTAGAAGGASAAGNGSLMAAAAAADEVAACHCESVFSVTQVVLSVLLPLLLLGCAEASQRRQFAACQVSTAAQREEAEGSRGARRRRRRSGSAAWCVSYDGMRLLALLTLIQFRVFLSLRFGVWQTYSSGVGSPTEASPTPLHTEL